MKTFVSVVIPMHNEQENAAETLAAVAEVLKAAGWRYELIPVDDGSTDDTRDALALAEAADERVRPVSYRVNRGRGYALRRGFAIASGDFVASIDADLSYEPATVVRMVTALLEDADADLVLASPYMPGGAVDGVPPMRLALSRGGNWVLRRALPQPIWTSTGIVRAYRADVLRSLDLESDGKEIHLEILSDAMALGYRVIEIPATLATRRKGTSKFRPRSTMISHLAFTLLERSAWLFAIIGVAVLLLGVIVAGYLLTTFFNGSLNPERPLMTVMVLLFVGGAVGLSFSLVAMQFLGMRRMIVRLQADVLRLGDKIDVRESARDAATELRADLTA